MKVACVTFAAALDCNGRAAMRIDDADALEKLGKLEGTDWVRQQKFDHDVGEDDEHSFFGALLRYQETEPGCSEIYGAGGWARYLVNSRGEVRLSGGSTHEEKRAAARELGITVTDVPAPADERAREAADRRRRADRKEDLRDLCLALARDVLVYSGNPNALPENPEMTTLMAARITGWVAARLGVTTPTRMSATVEAAMRQCRDRKSFQMPTDVL
jgi:hypothetical protein